ncbi:MAG: oligosaccharide repeat unit polymerase [Firmicutes bacterium]|nr:oligosaccharide repeat unit polymerase [Bacillota bacterium]
MLILLLFVLLVIEFLLYIINHKELLHPSIWFVSAFVFSTFIALINSKAWGDISIFTVLVILLGVVSFLIGSISGTIIVSKLKAKKDLRKLSEYYVSSSIKKSIVIIVILFMFIITIQYFVFIYNQSVLAGNPGGLNAMLSYVRSISRDSELFSEVNSFINYGLIISQAFGFIFAFICIKNSILSYKKFNFVYLVPIIIYLVQAILTTGRTKMINFLVFMFFSTLVIIKEKKLWSKKLNRIIIRYMILMVIIILVIFMGIDLTLRGSIYGTEWTVFYQISKYTGSSIKAFDLFLRNIVQFPFSGDETLYNIYSILNRFGFHFEIGSNALQSVHFSNITTNVYTALRRYIHDYGFFGMVLIQFILGLLFSSVFEYIKKGYNNGTLLILYSMNMYIIVYMSIEERFFLSAISINSMVTIIIVALLWKFVVKTKYLRRISYD